MPADSGLFESLLRSIMDAYISARVETGAPPLDQTAAIEYAARRARALQSSLDTDRAKLTADLRERQIKEGWSEVRYIDELQSKGYSGNAARRYARTESAIVYGEADAKLYEEQGVEYVKIFDGTDDAPCKYANGAYWTLEDYIAHPIAHPNCVRIASPVPDFEVATIRHLVRRPSQEELDSKYDYSAAA